MAKVAVVFAPGCEEVEGLTIVDVLRRMGIETTMVGLEDLHVPGAHGIELTCDEVMSDRLLNYDVVAFPGGRGGAQKLRDNDKLMKLMQKRNAENKWDAAMCAAPIALARYGLLDNQTILAFRELTRKLLRLPQQQILKMILRLLIMTEKSLPVVGPQLP